MPQKTAIPKFDVLPGETITPRIDCTPLLQGTETISSVNSVTEQGSAAAFTISDESTNSSAETIRGTSVVANKAAKFKAVVSGSAAVGEYILVVTIVTNSSPAQTRKFRVVLNVVAEATNT